MNTDPPDSLRAGQPVDRQAAVNRTGSAVPTTLPVTTTADGSDEARSYINEGIGCYHKAGHAAAFWHYGIEIQYVTMRPPEDSGHAGQTVTVERGDLTTIAEFEETMHCVAAGAIAQVRLFTLKEVPTDYELIRDFERNAAIVKEITDPARFGYWNDDLMFPYFGLGLDEEVRKADPGAPVGPETWVRVWRDAERLIRGELWPAARAIAEELRRRPNRVSGGEVAALAVVGMSAGK